LSIKSIHTGWHIVGSLKANAKAKTRQRASLFSTPFLRTIKKLNLLRQENGMTEMKKYLKPFTDKNAQLVTKAKIKRAVSGKSKVCTSKKLHRKLTVKCSEMLASF